MIDYIMKMGTLRKFKTLCKHYIKDGFSVDAWFWDAIDEDLTKSQRRDNFIILRDKVDDIRGQINLELDEILSIASSYVEYEEPLPELEQKTNFILTGDSNTSLSKVKSEQMEYSDSSFVDSEGEIWMDSTCAWDVVPEKEDDGVYFMDSTSVEEEPESKIWQSSDIVC